MPVHLICHQCGSTYKVPPSVAAESKYCGHPCYWKSRMADPTIPKYLDSQCAWCGETFSAKWNATLGRRPECCSVACARKLGGSQRPATWLTCHQCGSRFRVSPRSAERGARYCSRRCMGDAKKKDPEVPLQVDTACPVCAVVFPAKWEAAKQRRQECCSNACAMKLLGSRRTGDRNPWYKPKVVCVCANCGKSFEKFPCRVHTHAGRKADFCSKICLYVHNHGKKKERTDIEIAMAKILTDAGISFEEQVPLYERWIADFIIESSRLVIFCDGAYWHDRPRVAAKDRGQTAYLEKCGWNVLRFNDDEILKTPDACLCLIQFYAGMASQRQFG
jgi:very-short-patch-repair endonuclease